MSPVTMKSAMPPENQAVASDEADEADAIGTLLRQLMRAAHSRREVIRHRKCWPRDVPYRVGFALRHQAFEVYEGWNVIEMLDCTGEILDRFIMAGGLPGPPLPGWRDRTYELPPDCLSASAVTLGYQIRMRHRDVLVLPGEPIMVPIKWVDSVDEIVTPVNNEELQRMVQVMLDEARLSRHADSSLRLLVPEDWPDDVALALVLELRAGIEIVASVEYYCDPTCRERLMQLGPDERGTPVSVPLPIPASQLRDLAEAHDGILQLKAFGSPIVALRDFERTQYWAGAAAVQINASMR